MDAPLVLGAQPRGGAQDGQLPLAQGDRAPVEPLTFRALQAACGALSPSVLRQRLSELREARLVEHDGQRGYALTAQARRLLPTLLALHAWAEEWARG